MWLQRYAGDSQYQSGISWSGLIEKKFLMINFIIKTVEIITHILYNKKQARKKILPAFYIDIEQEDITMSLRDLDYKKGGIFAAGVLFGTAGIKALSSKDAKNVYTKVTAAVLRAKDCVLDVVSNIQENAQDIYAGAQQINDDLAAANEAAEAEGQDEAEETAEAEKNETEEKAE